MIGCLPKSLEVNGIQRAIRSDYRVALIIFQGYNDTALSSIEQANTMIDSLYVDFVASSQAEWQEAIEKAVWFLDGGKEHEELKDKRKVIDWEQDEQLIFPAVNKVAGYETRAIEYLHWWTFLGLFNEIGEGLFSSVVNIRNKKNKSQKLEKYEQDFYKEYKQLIDLKTRYSEEEQAEIDELNKLLG